MGGFHAHGGEHCFLAASGQGNSCELFLHSNVEGLCGARTSCSAGQGYIGHVCSSSVRAVRSGYGTMRLEGKAKISCPRDEDYRRHEARREKQAMAARAMTARLLKYAKLAGLWYRKFTMRPLRVGAAVARAIAGQDVATIMAAIGWKSKEIASRYMGKSVPQKASRAVVLENAEE